MLSAQYNTSKNTKNYANPTEDNPTGLKSYMNYTQAYKPADTPAFDMYGITKTGNVSNRFVPAPEMKKEELLGFSEFLANKVLGHKPKQSKVFSGVYSRLIQQYF
jgi:hypothetical protein